MTDLWPDEEGLIVAGLDVGFFYANNTVTEGSPVKLATGTSGYIKCQNGAAVGDAIGVALKSASSTEYVPIALTGVIKIVMCTGGEGAVTTGDFLINSLTQVCKASGASTNYKAFGGSSYMLGLALQPGTATGDELLMWLGKTV